MTREDGVMGTLKKCSPVIRECVLRMVLEHEHGSRWAASRSVASKIG